MTDKITLELTLDELKLIDKYVELNDETESVFDKIKDAYPPVPDMELLKDGSVYCVDYNNVTYYRQEYRHSNGWIKWWRENDEGGILTRVDDAETFRLLEKLFSADIAANPDGSLKFMFGPTLYDVIADWWDEIFVNGNPSGQNVESLVEQIKEWLPQPQSAAGSQSLGVEDMVTGWNDCLERIKSKLS